MKSQVDSSTASAERIDLQARSISESRPGKAPLPRIASSFLAAIALFVLAQYALCSFYKNLNPEEKPQTQLLAIIEEYVGRLKRFFDSNEQADVVMMGSSLLHCPVTYMDLQYEPAATLNNFARYSFFVENFLHSRFLQDSLKQRLKRSVSVVSLSVPSSVVSDDALLCEKLFESGKKPLILVCCIAPRDFLVRPTETGPTPIQELFADYTTVPELLKFSVPVVNLFDFVGQCFGHYGPGSTWEFWHRKNILFFEQAFHDAGNDLVKQTQQLKGWRSVTELAKVIAMTADPANSSVKAAKSPAVIPQAFRKTLWHLIEDSGDHSDLSSLSQYYRSSDSSYAYMIGQFGSLGNLLNMAKHRSVPVMLVLMPISKENSQLFHGRLRQAYDKELVNIVKTWSPIVWCPDTGANWASENFSDSTHLNIRGAKRLFSQLPAKLADFPGLKMQVP